MENRENLGSGSVYANTMNTTHKLTMLLEVAIKDPIQVYFSLHFNPIAISFSQVHSLLHYLYMLFNFNH